MMDFGFYTLDADGMTAVRTDMEGFAALFETPGRRVLAQNEVGNYLVSTVFLATNHRFLGKGKPLLWETMVFKDGDWSELLCWRETSWVRAAARHRMAMRIVRGWLS